MRIRIKNGRKSSSVSPSRLIVIDSDDDNDNAAANKVDLENSLLVAEPPLGDAVSDDELLYMPGDDLSASENDADEAEPDDVDNTVEAVFLIAAAAAHKSSQLEGGQEVEEEVREKLGAYGQVLEVYCAVKPQGSRSSEPSVLLVRMCGLSADLRQVTTALKDTTIGGIPVEISIRSGKSYICKKEKNSLRAVVADPGCFTADPRICFFFILDLGSRFLL
jgi:hypothetical protein